MSVRNHSGWMDQEVIFIVIVFENFKIELDVSEFSSMQSLMIWRFLTRVRNVKPYRFETD